MKRFETTIWAVCPIDGEMKHFAGPLVPGINRRDAELYCQQNGLGYCAVGDEVVCEIPTAADGVTPDWSKRQDYDNLN